jgi:hypothetical protein
MPPAAIVSSGSVVASHHRRTVLTCSSLEVNMTGNWVLGSPGSCRRRSAVYLRTLASQLNGNPPGSLCQPLAVTLLLTSANVTKLGIPSYPGLVIQTWCDNP